MALSREPARVQAVEPSPAVAKAVEDVSDAVRTPVVVAARALQPFTPVTREDLAVEQLRVAPAGSFSRVEDVLGRAPWGVVPAGTWLSADNFEAGGPLARMIRPDERAVAVAVDEVIGGGGHLRPGDYVDVLLVMRDAADARERTAQVAVPALRLLSYGDTLGPQVDGRPAGEAKKEGEVHQAPRTAVLAVPQGLVTRLMLASQAGTLRLAVRSSEERLLTRYQAGEVQPVALDDSIRSLLDEQQLDGRASAPIAAPSPSVRRQPAQASVEVVRGGQISRQIP
ncbi:Flp pilus assembly protein CpaB [compost metagenome]